jgi:phosphotransferase system enzyme I (PtsI)
VCICGELVHNLDYLALFISMGLRDFSVAPFYLNRLLEKIHELEVKIEPLLDEKIDCIRTKNEIYDLNDSLITTHGSNRRIID